MGYREFMWKIPEKRQELSRTKSNIERDEFIKKLYSGKNAIIPDSLCELYPFSFHARFNGSIYGYPVIGRIAFSQCQYCGTKEIPEDEGYGVCCSKCGAPIDEN